MAAAVPTQPVETPLPSEVALTEVDAQSQASLPPPAPKQTNPNEIVPPAAEVQTAPTQVSPNETVPPAAEVPTAPSPTIHVAPPSGSNESGEPSNKTKQNLEELSKANASPPNRTLELAGLQALMQQQKQREAAGVGMVRIDWTTHKKEGMRLKRLMEESPDGAKFPHMQQLFSGSKEVP